MISEYPQASRAGLLAKAERASLHSRYPSACQFLAVDFAPYTDALTATKLNRPRSPIQGEGSPLEIAVDALFGTSHLRYGRLLHQARSGLASRRNRAGQVRPMAASIRLLELIGSRLLKRIVLPRHQLADSARPPFSRN